MSTRTLDLLKLVIDAQHGGRSTFSHTVRVMKQPAGKDVWDGAVHVYAIEGLPAATRAFAWAAPVAGTQNSNYFAVLQQGAVRDPVDAVKAVVKAMRQAA